MAFIFVAAVFISGNVGEACGEKFKCWSLKEKKKRFNHLIKGAMESTLTRCTLFIQSPRQLTAVPLWPPEFYPVRWEKKRTQQRLITEKY